MFYPWRFAASFRNDLRMPHREAIALLALCGALCATALADSSEPPAHHQAIVQAQRSERLYTVPEVKLVRQDGKRISLADELNDDRPVVMNFIYTSCTSICPLSSQIFEQFQKSLGTASRDVHLVSISIDPEQDSPGKLREYASQFDAGPGWDHYTGTLNDSQTVQRAFGAYFGDKMSHVPLTLMRLAPGKPWVRFDGFVSAEQLLAERQRWGAPTSARLTQ